MYMSPTEEEFYLCDQLLTPVRACKTDASAACCYYLLTCSANDLYSDWVAGTSKYNSSALCLLLFSHMMIHVMVTCLHMRCFEPIMSVWYAVKGRQTSSVACLVMKVCFRNYSQTGFDSYYSKAEPRTTTVYCIPDTHSSSMRAVLSLTTLCYS